MGHNILRASSPLTLERWLIGQLVIPKSLLAHAFFTQTGARTGAHTPRGIVWLEKKLFFSTLPHLKPLLILTRPLSHGLLPPTTPPPPPNSIHPPTSNVPTGVLMLAVIMNHFLFDRVMLAMTGAQFRHCCPLSKIKLHGWFIRFFFLTRFLLYFNYIINNVQISWYLKRRTQIGINQSSRRVLSMTDCHGVLLRSFLMSRRDFGGHPRACLEKVSRRISHA